MLTLSCSCDCRCCARTSCRTAAPGFPTAPPWQPTSWRTFRSAWIVAVSCTFCWAESHSARSQFWVGGGLQHFVFLGGGGIVGRSTVPPIFPVMFVSIVYKEQKEREKREEKKIAETVAVSDPLCPLSFQSCLCQLFKKSRRKERKGKRKRLLKLLQFPIMKVSCLNVSSPCFLKSLFFETFLCGWIKNICLILHCSLREVWTTVACYPFLSVCAVFSKHWYGCHCKRVCTRS